MKAIEFIEIGDGKYCPKDLLQDAFEDGIIDPDYQKDIVRQIRRQAVQEAAHGVIATIRGTFAKLAASIGLEVRLYAFDKIHGTSYRSAAHAEIERIRRERFVKSLEKPISTVLDQRVTLQQTC
jgi:hypothetical protein